jgi:beta-galactosidase
MGCCVNPVNCLSLIQASGFILYRSKLPASVQPGSRLSVVQVYDRAQVFVGNNSANRMYLGTLERWSANSLTVATAAALPGSQLDIVVENMGRVNYGPFMGENKGITEAVLLDDTPILGWTAYPIELNDISKITSNIVTRRRMFESGVEAMTTDPDLAEDLQVGGAEDLQVGGGGPAFYRGVLKIENSQKSADTFLSFRGWTKGVAFVNGFNLGRFWPVCCFYSKAPFCHTQYIYTTMKILAIQ